METEIIYAVGFSDDLRARKPNKAFNPHIEMVATEQEAIDICEGMVIEYVPYCTVDGNRVLFLNMMARANHECNVSNREHCYYSPDYAAMRSA